MKRICLVLAAALSLAENSAGATRPHYGGTLRFEVRGSLSSFEIVSDMNRGRALLRDLLLGAVCDRLVTVDDNGNPRPSLATAWRSDREGRAWYFTIRSGIMLQNGTPLTSAVAAAALAAQNPAWRIQASGTNLTIESDTPVFDMPYEMAASRNSVCVAGSDGRWIGSGPFQIGDFKAAQYVDLQSFDDSWQGRPFLDRIHILMGRSLSDQVSDFQLARTDAIEADPSEPRPTSTSLALFTRPIELIALVFNANHRSASDPRVRTALAKAIDRNSIYSVLLRRQGESSAALLPEWISGYAHLFNAAQDLGTAVRLRNQVQPLVPLSFAYDGSDDLLRLIGDRIAVNAQQAGITLLPRSESPLFRGFDADGRLVRLRLESSDAAAALKSLGEVLDNSGLEQAGSGGAADNLYTLESDALKDYSIIPLAQIPEAFVLAPAVHDWKINLAGNVDLGSVWIEATK